MAKVNNYVLFVCLFVCTVEMFEKLPSSPSYPLPPNMSPQFSSLEVSCPELQLDSGKSVSTKKIYLCCHAVGTRTMAVTVRM